MKPDRITKRWIRNAADERAARDGCQFDERRAEHFLDFCRQHLRLWEGDQAGKAMELLGWQREVASRMFGWVRPSAKFGRTVRRFRRASVWVPKKNGKSPLAAAIGLYLMAYDGEPGQAVYSAARDGKQAQIIHRHAQRMAEASPTLRTQIKIHRQTGRIVHVPTLSHYSILAGDNYQSQEGYNGSVIVDEVHVVDERLALVLQDAGASRSEPIQFEVSTAGASIDCYGRKQWEYGRSVNDGKTLDQDFLYCAWEAPQDASDEKLADPEVWQAANPAWGETIDPVEFASAYERAKRSAIDWANFKQRRLNIWQRAATPWINVAEWDACRNAEITLSDFDGLAVGVGLDLSRVADMTAACVAAVQDGVIGLWPRFWLPRRRAEQLAHLVPLKDWADAGAITLIEGDVVDYDVVLDDLASLCEAVNAGVICYDPLFAEDFTQRLSERTGIQRVEFRQTFDRYSLPTSELERAVKSANLVHPGNPVLDWQIGHALCKEYGGKRKPLKDGHAPHRTIDGVQAACMGLAAAWIAAETGSKASVYAQRDMVVL